MKTKKEIVTNWLPRYTGMELKDFGQYILLCNFTAYIEKFARTHGVRIKGRKKAMQCATAQNITMINFGMGSAMAATVMDLVSALSPKAVLFLGKCGGLKDKTTVGSFILPIAGIRGDGASNSFFPPEVPALPAFALQKAVSTTLRDNNLDYRTGTVYTTDRRVWEHDSEFKEYLVKIRVMAIDMETATILSVGFFNDISTGALLLVSDEPMTPEGVKTRKSDKAATKKYLKLHVRLGVESLAQIMKKRLTVRHLVY